MGASIKNPKRKSNGEKTKSMRYNESRIDSRNSQRISQTRNSDMPEI